MNSEFERHTLSKLVHIDQKSLGKKTPEDFTFSYISLSDVSSGNISKTLEKHSFKSAPSRARRVLQNGDIIMATVRPNLQGFAKITEEFSHCVASTGFAVLSPKDNVSGEFIYQCLYSYQITKQIESLVVGSNYPAINSSDVAGLHIYTPPYPEQRKIAKILSTWDKAISTTERLIDNSKQQKKALMQQLLTGAHTQRKRLLDESGKPFEDEWEEASLDLLCRFTQGFQVGVEEQIPDAEIGSVRFIRIVDYTKDNEPPRYVKLKSNYYLVDESDVVMVRYGEAGLACRGLKGVIANNMFLIAPKADSLSKLFLYEVLKFFYQKISSLAASSTMPALKFSDLKQFKIKLPNIIEQHKITSLLNNADKEIELLEQQLADLKQEKKALMQQLLTGKRRVKVDDKEVA